MILDPYNFPFWVLISSIIIVVIGMITRPFLTHAMFAYPNALFEAMGNPYLEEKQLGNIIESKDLHAFKEVLNSLKDYHIDCDDTYSVQKSLDDHYFQILMMMQKNNSKKMSSFYRMYREKMDIYYIKNQLKKFVLGKGEDVEIRESILPSTKLFLGKLKDAGTENLPEILASFGFEKELVEAIMTEHPDIQTIDIEFDKYILEKFSQVTVPYKCEEVKQSFIKMTIDVMNIKNVLRAKHLGYDAASCKQLFLGEGWEVASWKFNEMAEVDQVSQAIAALEGLSYFSVLKDAIEQYTKENSVQILENVLDGYFLKLVKDLSLKYYLNLGPTLRFLVSKEVEIQNLKVIAKGIGERLSSDHIKKLLVMEVG